MNDEIEHRPGTQRRATQTGCPYWTPIAPRAAETKDAAKVKPALSDPAEDPMPPVHNAPD